MEKNANDIEVLREKAEGGDAEAQFLLGSAYDKGDEVERDFGKAVGWFLKAAEQGNVDAQFNLGVSYEQGQGVERDLKTAVKWYHKAADQGDSDAQFNLGEAYEEGRGIEQNIDEAIKWFRKAAEQEDAEAQKRLQKLIKSQGESPEPFVPDGYKDILWPKNQKRKSYRIAFYITLPLAIFFLLTTGYSLQTVVSLISAFFLKNKSEKI